MNYDNMTDFEINKAVADCTNTSYTTKFYPKKKDQRPSGYLEVDGLCGRSRLDYCNNPSDGWPIIVDNEISLLRDVSTNDVWEAVGKAWYTVEGLDSKGGTIHIDNNPLRAAMIVFLMMQEGK